MFSIHSGLGPRGCAISYVERLRDLQKHLSLEHDPVRRQEILDRMLFLIEAQSRDRRIAEETGQAVTSPHLERLTD